MTAGTTGSGSLGAAAVSEGAGGAVSVQDKGAQVQDTMEDPLGEHQKNQEDPSLRIDPSLSPAKKKQKLIN